MDTKGNIALLERHRIGFLSGSKIAPLSVLPTFDWASEVAARDDVAIISGFHSQLERQVLGFLLRGRCGIICALARSMYSKVPPEYALAMSTGRVLFVTDEECVRTTKESAMRRNELVVALADEVVVPDVSPDSSVCRLVADCRKALKVIKG